MGDNNNKKGEGYEFEENSMDSTQACNERVDKELVGGEERTKRFSTGSFLQTEFSMRNQNHTTKLSFEKEVLLQISLELLKIDYKSGKLNYIFGRRNRKQ